MVTKLGNLATEHNRTLCSRWGRGRPRTGFRAVNTHNTWYNLNGQFLQRRKMIQVKGKCKWAPNKSGGSWEIQILDFYIKGLLTFKIYTRNPISLGVSVDSPLCPSSFTWNPPAQTCSFYLEMLLFRKSSDRREEVLFSIWDIVTESHVNYWGPDPAQPVSE